MKKTLILFMVIFFSMSLSAQNVNSFNYLKGFPSAFSLYVPDHTTQILFNPARAYNKDQSFVYVTKNAEINYYYPYVTTSYISFGDIGVSDRLSADYYVPSNNNNNSNENSFSGGALFNTSYGKFLVQTDFVVSKSEYTNNYENEYNDYYAPNSIVDTKYLNGNKVSFNSSFFSARVIKIDKSDDYGISYGINLNYSPSESNVYNSNSSSRDGRYSYWVQSDYARKLISNGKNSYENSYTNNQTDLGLEFGISKQDWDLTAQLTYSFGKNDGKRLSAYYNYNSETFTNQDNTAIQSNEILYLLSSSGSNSAKLTGINAAFFISHKSDFATENDNWFVSGNWSKMENDITSDFSIDKKINTISSNSGTSSETYSSSVSDLKNHDSKLWVELHTGYSVKVNMNDLDIIMGSQFGYSYTKNQTSFYSYYPSYYFYYSSNAPILNENVCALSSRLWSLDLPLFISYDPFTWLNMRGGFNYTFNMNDNDSESNGNPILFPISTVGNTSMKSLSNSSFNGYYQTSNSYFGATLKHSSGINLYISFNNDILAYKTWDLSLMYNF